jgi:hypothetical protein
MVMQTITDEQLINQERARRAVLEARKRLPFWQSFARILARRPNLKVVLHSGISATDGDIIWIRVPIELGDEVDHDKVKCGKRRPNKMQSCKACRVSEVVDTTILHEIAHQVFETFENIDASEKDVLITRAIESECKDSRMSDALRNKLETSFNRRSSYYTVMATISPYMGLLMNACEDIRVNKLMQRARPGTVEMFQALYAGMLEGNEASLDGTVTKMEDAPANLQIALAMIYKLSDYEFDEFFKAKVVEDLKDEALNVVLDKVRNAESVRDIYNQSFPLLRNLRRLGYFLTPDDPQEEKDEPEPEQPEDDSFSDGSDEDNSPGMGDSSDDPDADSGEADDEASDDQGAPTGEPEADSGSGGDESSDDEQGDASGDSSESDEPAPSESDSNADGSGADSDDGEPGDANGDSSDVDSDDEAPASSGGQGSSLDGEGSGTTEGSLDSDIGSDSGNDDDLFGQDESPSYSEEDQQADGTPEEVEKLLKKFTGHADEVEGEEPEFDQNLMDRAINQAEHFDTPSQRIGGLRVSRYEDKEMGWGKGREFDDVVISESILAPALNRLRLVFTQNKARRNQRNLKTGKINTRALGRRAPQGDPRVFQRMTLPNKVDYFVVIGADFSGSTGGNGALQIIKEGVIAKAELLSRLNIPFAVYGHSGTRDTTDFQLDVCIMEFKAPNEPWGDIQRKAVSQAAPFMANLDGHTLEFYRKVAQKSKATNRIILYYTDGEMPNANFEEELEILKREITNCKKLDISLVGIGVGTDSPEEHGLETVVLDSVEDVPTVIDKLREKLGG